MSKKEVVVEEKKGKTYTPERMVRQIVHMIRKPVYGGFFILPSHLSNHKN